MNNIPEMMKGCVLAGPGKLEIRDVPVPVVENPHDAILRFRLGTICSSDWHTRNHHNGTPEDDRVYGHEFIGEVVSVGAEAAKTIKVGQRYMVKGAHYCGECDHCKAHIYSFCENGGVMGSRFPATSPAGCFSEYVKVIWADRGTLYPLPDDVSDEQAMMVCDVLSTGAFLVENAGIKVRDSVCIIGQGPIGVGAALTAKKLYRSKMVIGVDVIQSRLDAALEHGAIDYAINADSENVVQRVMELTGGKGVDISGDSSGAPNCLDTMIAVTKLGGVLSSISSASTMTFNMGYMMIKNQTFKVGIQDFSSYDSLIDLIRAGELDCTWMHTHVRPLNDLVEGFNIFGNHLDGCIKWIITPYDHSRD